MSKQMVKKLLAMLMVLALCISLSAPALAASDEGTSAVTHVVHRGDNLSKLSLIYYGNRFGWKRIYEANKDVVENPNLIFIGQKLTIPGATQKPASIDFKNLLVKGEADNWYNAAMGAVYSSVEEMDLALVFYAWSQDGGSWDSLVEDEIAYLLEKGFNPNYAVQKRSAKQLDEILKQYFDTTLEDCSIPESWIYIPETDCYYSNTNDAYVVHRFEVTEVVYSGDLIYIYYEVEPYRGAFDPVTEKPVTQAMLTMKQRVDGSYVVISNQNTEIAPN